VHGIVGNPIHDHHKRVERRNHARGMESPDGMPDRQIVGRSRRMLDAEAEAARLVAFVAWLRDQVSGDDGKREPGGADR